MRLVRTIFVKMILAAALAFLLPAPFAGAMQEANAPQEPAEGRVQVRIVSDEADAVLDILDKRAESAEVTAADWQKLLSSEGYRRLKKRLRGLQAPAT